MKKTSLLVVAAALLSAGVAQAQNALIDYQGYAWETGGFPPSNANDELKFVGVVDALDSRFGVNLATNEVTIYVYGLLSTGQVDIGGGVLSIAYNGGNIELYDDSTPDHDYGTSPPNATAPSTFVDGTAFLIGTLSDFFLFFDPSTGSGAYEGNCSFTSGSGLSTLNQLNASGYTFGGVLDSAASAGNVPAGYDLQVDGVIEVEVIVGVEEKSWGAVKGLYRR
jgi:hypothetical protein